MWHESTWHQHRALGGPCSRPHDVEKHFEPTPQDRGKEAGECRSRKNGLQKGAQQPQQTRDHTQKCDLCGRDCFFHIGLYSHKRRCNNRTDRTTRMYSHYQTWSTEAIAVTNCVSLWQHGKLSEQVHLHVAGKFCKPQHKHVSFLIPSHLLACYPNLLQPTQYAGKGQEQPENQSFNQLPKTIIPSLTY